MPDNEQLDDNPNALRLSLEKFLASIKPTEVDPRREFYNAFNREADEYDRDFHKKYHDDLNTSLIFAGLFSAVASAFVIDIQQELRPDYTQMSFTVLTMLLNTTSGIPNQLPIPVVSGPNPSAVRVQSILFSSIASSLFAALLAMLGKQWLNLHVEGSLVDRSRHRELKMRGMITWRFRMIMECLPLIMQTSLLLLGCALTQYVWDLSRTVSAVIASFTVFGALFYFSIVFAATVWKTCPFQTPVSLVLRLIISWVREPESPPRRWLRIAQDRLSRMIDWLRRIPDKLSEVIYSGLGNESFVTASDESTNLELALDPQAPHDASASNSTVVNLEDEGTHVSDTNCISTMFRLANGSEAIVAVTGFILEVNWTLKIRRVPLPEVCQSLLKSFELSGDGRKRVRPGMKEQARGSAKALAYLRVQRLCAGATDSANTIAALLQPLLLKYRFEGDHELASTLRVLDAVFDGNEDIPWGEFAFNESHYCWLSHIIRCRAWAILRAQKPLTKDISGFILYSFSKETLPPRVIADCLLVVSMIVGPPPKLDDNMLIKDRSSEIEEILCQVYKRIELSLTSHSSEEKRKLATEALEFMVPLKQGMLCVESYRVFRTVMGNVESHSWLWFPARLLLFGAFKWGMEPPPTGDPAELVHFLEHCLLEQKKGSIQDEPIERVMLALAGATADELGGGLERVDFTEPLFFDGICHALREGAPYELRRATVAFLRHLDSHFFDTDKTFTQEQATTFVSLWSVSAKESWGKKLNTVLAEALVTTLMGLLDSAFWRSYIPGDLWDILRIASSLDDNLPRSLYRCFKNDAIIPHLDTDGHSNGALIQLMAIMWMKYPDLSEEVSAQLRKTTKKRNDIATYLTLLDGEINRIEKKISAYGTWSFEEPAVRLKERRGKLLSARRILEENLR